MAAVDRRRSPQPRRGRQRKPGPRRQVEQSRRRAPAGTALRGAIAEVAARQERALEPDGGRPEDLDAVDELAVEPDGWDLLTADPDAPPPAPYDVGDALDLLHGGGPQPILRFCTTPEGVDFDVPACDALLDPDTVVAASLTARIHNLEGLAGALITGQAPALHQPDLAAAFDHLAPLTQEQLQEAVDYEVPKDASRLIETARWVAPLEFFYWKGQRGGADLQVQAARLRAVAREMCRTPDARGPDIDQAVARPGVRGWSKRTVRADRSLLRSLAAAWPLIDEHRSRFPTHTTWQQLWQDLSQAGHVSAGHTRELAVKLLLIGYLDLPPSRAPA